MSKKFSSKKFIIPRAAFETSGFRIISLALGSVIFPDGRNCSFNVRLMAKPGSEGDIVLIAEDINRETSHAKGITLRRADGP